MTKASEHTPVMVSEVVAAMSPVDGETYVDATFGRGGYTRALLNQAHCRVVAIDRDPEAHIMADDCKQTFGDRFTFIHGKFSDLAHYLHTIGITHVNGIVADLGVSSPQLDTAARGFSFDKAGPLDMRMGQDGISAADVVNTYAEDDLIHIIRDLGEEKYARRIARGIVAARALSPLTTTDALVAVIKDSVGRYEPRLHPATRTFQALRLYVNRELEELEALLASSLNCLAEGGRLVCVSFHSLEDRIVKQFMRHHAGGEGNPNRHAPMVHQAKPTLRLLTKKALEPSADEVRLNPRSRSAHLRAAIRLACALFGTWRVT